MDGPNFNDSHIYAFKKEEFLKWTGGLVQEMS